MILGLGVSLMRRREFITNQAAVERRAPTDRIFSCRPPAVLRSTAWTRTKVPPGRGGETGTRAARFERGRVNAFRKPSGSGALVRAEQPLTAHRAVGPNIRALPSVRATPDQVTTHRDLNITGRDGTRPVGHFRSAAAAMPSIQPSTLPPAGSNSIGSGNSADQGTRIALGPSNLGIP